MHKIEVFSFKVPVSSGAFFLWPETGGGGWEVFRAGSAGVLSGAESANPPAAAMPRGLSFPGCFLSVFEDL